MPKAARYRLCVISPDGRDITDPKSSRATMFEAIKYLGVANVSKLAPNIVSTDIDSLGKHARAKPPTQMSRERNDESTRIRTWEGYFIDVDVKKSTTEHRAELLKKWASALNVNLEITVRRI